MHKTFSRIDEVLFSRVFQPLTDLLMERLGIARGSAACFCLDLASVGWIVARSQTLSDAVTAWDAAAATGQAAILLVGLAAMTALRSVFRIRANVRQGNPLRVKMLPHRAIVLLMLIARLLPPHGSSMSDLADIFMLIAVTTALYLGACGEPPPVRRALVAFARASVR